MKTYGLHYWTKEYPLPTFETFRSEYGRDQFYKILRVLEGVTRIELFEEEEG
jgi:hypothetical protein